MNNKSPLYFSVGICAYNEEKNIGKLLRLIYIQKLRKEFKIREIIVIASGCTDKTTDIVKKLQSEISIIKLIIQKQRQGKAKAVNIFIKNAKSTLLILHSADTLIEDDCYHKLLKSLQKTDVGMVGGKVIPTDNPDTFCGYANHLKWKLHHLVNVKFPERPKLGELVAFKKIFKRIPPTTAVDEASIEPLIKLQDYKVVYEPNAIIYNTGPKTIRELLSQRRRIFAGHYATKITYGYEVITFSNFLILPILLSTLELNIKSLFFTSFTILLEVVARISGYLDIKYKLRDHSVWKTVKTSKSPRLI